jgi:hypothetical protein
MSKKQCKTYEELTEKVLSDYRWNRAQALKLDEKKYKITQ